MVHIFLKSPHYYGDGAVDNRFQHLLCYRTKLQKIAQKLQQNYLIHIHGVVDKKKRNEGS